MLLPARTPTRPAVFLSLVVLAGLIAVVHPWSHPSAEARAREMHGWSLIDLVRHLESRGLQLRAVPTQRGGPFGLNAYFAAGNRSWEELIQLPKNPTAIGRWSGVVYCERTGGSEVLDGELESWNGCALEVGPFAFVGDPELLARIRAALPSEA